MFTRIGILILQIFVATASSANADNFQTEKEFIKAQFNCEQEVIYPETEISGAKWHCSDLNGNRYMQIARELGSQETITTLKLIAFTELDSNISGDWIELSSSIAEKFAGIDSTEVMDILKNCSSTRKFSKQHEISVGCVEGPVKIERHLIVKVLAAK